MQSFLRDHVVSAVLVAMVSSAFYFVGILGVNSARAQTATIDSVTIDKVTLNEHGREKAKITIVLDRRASRDQTFAINYPTSTTATAQHDVDFTGPTSVTIRERRRTGTFTVRAINDSKVEDDEIGEIRISGRNDPVRFTIVSDDVPPPPPTKILMSMRPYALKEGGGSRSRGRVLVVINQRAPEGGFPINIAYDSSSGLPNAAAKLGEDFTGPTSVTIPEGKFSTELHIETIDDEVHESGSFGLEFSRVVASSTAGGRTISQSVGFNIVDNDKKKKEDKQKSADRGGQVEPKEETQVAGGDNAETEQAVENSGAVPALQQEPSNVVVAETDEVLSTSGAEVAESKSEEAQVGSGICDRTPQVRDAIVAAISDVSNCADVTPEQLTTIQSLSLSRKNIAALLQGDFVGLTDLNDLSLSNNQLSTLPKGIFNKLGNLSSINLSNNQLSALPSGALSGLRSLVLIALNDNRFDTLPGDVFRGSTNLGQILLDRNHLTSLPADLFSGLRRLRRLILNNNQLSLLPAGIFSGLSNLETLDLQRNQLSALSSDVFNGLSQLNELFLQINQLNALPAGVFSGLRSLRSFNLSRNPGAPFPLAVRLERIGREDLIEGDQAQLRALVEGVPFVVSAVWRASGDATGSTSGILMIPGGELQSEPFVVSGDNGGAGNAVATVSLEQIQFSARAGLADDLRFVVGPPLELKFGEAASLTVSNVRVEPDMIDESGENNSSTVKVTLNGEAPEEGFTLPLTFAGTATRGADGDYTVPANSITVAQGQTTGSVTITSRDDTIDEDAETIVVSVTGRDDLDPATITITDDDVPAVAEISASPETIAEDDGEATVTVTLTQAPVSADGLTVPVTFSGSARLTKDYNARSDGFAVVNGNEVRLRFAQGVDRQTFTITAIADREKEDDESIVVTVGDRSATIALTDVFKESILAEVRRAGSFAMLRRSTDRFSRLTGDIVGARLRGGRFSKVTENSGFRTTVREFAGGLRDTRGPDGPNKLGLKDGADPAGKGGWDVWVSINGAKLSGVAEGSVFDIYAGVDTIVAPGILIGVLASYEAGDLETSGTGDLPGEGAYTGGFDSKGYSVGGYAGLRLLDDLTLDLAGSYGRLSPEVSAVFRDDGNKDDAVAGEYEARRMLLSGHLTGRAVFGNLLLSTQVGLIYARENQDGFTDSSNAEALAATLEFARIEFGTTLAYDFDLKPEHGAMGVTLTATGRSDFIRPDDVANQYSLAVRLGLEWANTTGLSLRLEGGADGIGLDDYDSYDASATVTVPF